MTHNNSERRNSMSFPALVSWAWEQTPPVHKNGVNLLIHLVAVPLFVVGNGLLIVAIVGGVRLFVVGVLCIAVSLTLQRFGHSLEAIQVHPFTGLSDFIRRLYAEQFCNFWRFLFSGRWYASFKARARNDQAGTLVK